MLAKTLKFLFKTCLVLMAFVLIYGGTTWLFAQFPIQTERDTSPKPIQIWITSNGVHTDIVMPIQNTVFNWEKSSAHKTRKANKPPSMSRWVGEINLFI